MHIGGKMWSRGISIRIFLQNLFALTLATKACILLCRLNGACSSDFIKIEDKKKNITDYVIELKGSAAPGPFKGLPIRSHSRQCWSSTVVCTRPTPFSRCTNVLRQPGSLVLLEAQGCTSEDSHDVPCTHCTGWLTLHSAANLSAMQESRFEDSLADASCLWSLQTFRR